MARLNENPYPVLERTALNNPVVFVVDMVNGFVNEGALADPTIQACIQPIQKLLDHCRPVSTVFVNDSHEPDAAEFAKFPPHCIKNSKEAQVVDPLQPYVHTVLEKNSIGAAMAPGFFDLLETLPEKGDLIVTGCCTDLCVLQLALPLQAWINQNNRHQMRVIVPVDCVETYEIPGVHNAAAWNEMALANLAANGIEVVQTIA